MSSVSRSDASADPRAIQTPDLPGRVLAIDYGRRRIGLAVSDELRLTAQPLATLERQNRAADLRRLREIARRNSAQLIVVGHPLHLDGGAGEMASEAERFAARIGKALGIPVELVDERLTSWEAHQTLAETRAASPGGVGARKLRRPGKAAARRPHHFDATGRRGAIDSVAAAVLLRDYLERRGTAGAAHPQEKD